jgi:hypothetical protein
VIEYYDSCGASVLSVYRLRDELTASSFDDDNFSCHVTHVRTVTSIGWVSVHLPSARSMRRNRGEVCLYTLNQSMSPVFGSISLNVDIPNAARHLPRDRRVRRFGRANSERILCVGWSCVRGGTSDGLARVTNGENRQEVLEEMRELVDFKRDLCVAELDNPPTVRMYAGTNVVSVMIVVFAEIV